MRHHIDRFETWQDALDAIASHKGKPTRGVEREALTGGASQFNGKVSWDESINLARFGWPEGKDKLEPVLELMQRQTYQRTKRKGYDIAGAYPSVARAIAGDPASMIRIKHDMKSQTPVIGIHVNRVVSASVSNRTIINRGAAILSACDDLEKNGFSCEIMVHDHGRDKSKKVEAYSLIFPIKRAGEALDLDRAAFLLMHPAATRRHNFHMFDRATDLNVMDYSGNYGFAEPDVGSDMLFGSLHISEEGLYATAESARQEACRIFAEAGYSL